MKFISLGPCAGFLVAAGFSLRVLKKTQAKACGYHAKRILQDNL